MPSSGVHHDHHQRQQASPEHGDVRKQQAGRDRSGPGTGRAGHERHAGHSVAMFRDRFWITLALTVPTLIWSHMIQDWLRFSPPPVPGALYMPAVFGTAVYFYGGWPFLAGGIRELRGHFPEYDVLVEEMPKYLRNAFISHDDLFAGKWEGQIDKLLAQPKPKKKPDTNGADVAAEILLKALDKPPKKPRGRPRAKF